MHPTRIRVQSCPFCFCRSGPLSGALLNSDPSAGWYEHWKYFIYPNTGVRKGSQSDPFHSCSAKQRSRECCCTGFWMAKMDRFKSDVRWRLICQLIYFAYVYYPVMHEINRVISMFHALLQWIPVLTRRHSPLCHSKKRNGVTEQFCPIYESHTLAITHIGKRVVFSRGDSTMHMQEQTSAGTNLIFFAKGVLQYCCPTV